MARYNRVEILDVSAQGSALEAVARSMASLSSAQGNRAMVRAINRTATMANTRVIRSVAKATSIPQRLVRPQVRVAKATPGRLAASIVGQGRTIPLRDMGARQTKTGVSANLYGRRQKFPGLFIMGGRPSSGRPAFEGHVLQNSKLFNRKSGRNNLARIQFGPSVAGGMRATVVRGEFDAAIATILPARLLHEIGRLLPS